MMILKELDEVTGQIINVQISYNNYEITILSIYSCCKSYSAIIMLLVLNRITSVKI